VHIAEVPTGYERERPFFVPELNRLYPAWPAEASAEAGKLAVPEPGSKVESPGSTRHNPNLRARYSYCCGILLSQDSGQLQVIYAFSSLALMACDLDIPFQKSSFSGLGRRRTGEARLPSKEGHDDFEKDQNVLWAGILVSA